MNVVSPRINATSRAIAQQETVDTELPRPCLRAAALRPQNGRIPARVQVIPATGSSEVRVGEGAAAPSSARSSAPGSNSTPCSAPTSRATSSHCRRRSPCWTKARPWCSPSAPPRDSAPGMTASKGALLSLVRPLAVEPAPRRIRVNAVSPGIVETPCTARWASPRHDRLLGEGVPSAASEPPQTSSKPSPSSRPTQPAAPRATTRSSPEASATTPVPCR
ncbi:SDR family oxidoreductase [Streptomyces olivaceus]|uniref:SDR family oxidoreductase n=1 Tax=Streptomyces olivaceus TaxID=47716 RepID=UPI0036CF31B7